MTALKQSMQAKGRAKVRDAVWRRMGKPAKEEEARPLRLRPSPRRTAHCPRRRGFCYENRANTTAIDQHALRWAASSIGNKSAGSELIRRGNFHVAPVLRRVCN